MLTCLIGTWEARVKSYVKKLKWSGKLKKFNQDMSILFSMVGKIRYKRERQVILSVYNIVSDVSFQLPISIFRFELSYCW